MLFENFILSKIISIFFELVKISGYWLNEMRQFIAIHQSLVRAELRYGEGSEFSMFLNF